MWLKHLHLTFDSRQRSISIDLITHFKIQFNTSNRMLLVDHLFKFSKTNKILIIVTFDFTFTSITFHYYNKKIYILSKTALMENLYRDVGLSNGTEKISILLEETGEGCAISETTIVGVFCFFTLPA